MFGSGCPSNLASRMTTLIISNEDMSDIMKSLLKNLVFWYKYLAKQWKIKPKNKKADFSVCN